MTAPLQVSVDDIIQDFFEAPPSGVFTTITNDSTKLEVESTGVKVTGVLDATDKIRLVTDSVLGSQVCGVLESDISLGSPDKVHLTTRGVDVDYRGMTLTSQGRVGFGVTDPSVEFEINSIYTVSLPSATTIGNVSSTEIGYLDGVTSSIQTQLNAIESDYQLSLQTSVNPTPSGNGNLALSSSVGFGSNNLLTYTPPDLDPYIVDPGLTNFPITGVLVLTRSIFGQGVGGGGSPTHYYRWRNIKGGDGCTIDENDFDYELNVTDITATTKTVTGAWTFNNINHLIVNGTSVTHSQYTNYTNYIGTSRIYNSTITGAIEGGTTVHGYTSINKLKTLEGQGRTGLYLQNYSNGGGGSQLCQIVLKYNLEINTSHFGGTDSAAHGNIILNADGKSVRLDTHDGATVTSDDRVKHNEVDISNGLEIIRQLKPQKYHKTKEMYAADYNGDISGNYNIESGLIAQDILKIPDLSYCVTGGDYIDEESGDYITSKYYLSYQPIFVHGLAAIKELDTIVQSQTELIQSQTALITELQARLSVLEAR